jgi:hypothetical protein
MRRVSLLPLLVLACVVVFVPGSVFADTMGTEWNFNGNLSAAYGPSTMSFWNGTEADTLFMDATNWTIDFPGAPHKTVLSTDHFGSTEGLAVSTGAANGGGTKINQYTIVMDVDLRSTLGSVDGYCTFYQTDSANLRDGKLAIDGGGAIGYETFSSSGAMPLSEWHRLAITVDAGASSQKVYVDGNYLMDPSAGHISLDGDWSLDANSQWLVFADNNGETGHWSIGNLYYTPRTMSGTEIAALGGPNGAGIMPIPEPSTLALLAAGLIGLLAYGWRKRK